MNEASRIAAELGLRPASEIEQPPLKMRSASGRMAPVRWAGRRRDVFNFLGPVSLSLVATDGPLSITLWDPEGGVRARIGHNRGVWPAKIVEGRAARDAATTTHNRLPGVFFGTQIRLWLMTERERARLSEHLVDLLALKSRSAEAAGGAGHMEHGCVDIGHVDLAFLEMEMHGLAQGLGIRVWDDFALVQWFDSFGRRFDAAQAARPELHWSERWVAKLASRDLGGDGR